MLRNSSLEVCTDHLELIRELLKIYVFVFGSFFLLLHKLNLIVHFIYLVCNEFLKFEEVHLFPLSVFHLLSQLLPVCIVICNHFLELRGILFIILSFLTCWENELSLFLFISLLAQFIFQLSHFIKHFLMIFLKLSNFLFFFQYLLWPFLNLISFVFDLLEFCLLVFLFLLDFLPALY